jgi:hypothetical protein
VVEACVALNLRWKDTETLFTCYQQPDADTLLAVMSEPKKICDAALASRGRRVGETAPQTAPPFSKAQSTVSAIADGASR